ncbi:hypothetical protein LJ707_00965 [Mucilaginibacter sp. UR6-1]|uniref:hypothetical protein n=1 Tax=Mucilaginibacter sp. UR6-1 TaxID=1435643 RepID=UPI001E4F4975|nr:hypothetical protein [Mucilaginibacter sp. UR6-1]MCC8407481.1 hypothetical protein [Mucilaginibacter sp. UR6-1]
MIKRLPSVALFVCLIFCFKNSSAQNNQLAGYIINGTDTTKGFIKYNNWDKSPTAIDFSTTQGGSYSTLTCKDVSEFGVYLKNSVEKYRTFNINIDKSSDNIQNYRKTPETVFEKKWIFALVLVDGSLQLYNYTDKRDHFIIRKGQGEATELISNKYIDQVSKNVVNNQQYKSQLYEAMTDCEKIDLKKARSLLYNAEALTNAVAQYNNCGGSTNNQNTNTTFEKGRSKLVFKALLGASFSKLSLTKSNNSDDPNNNVKSANNTQPVIGIGVDYILPRSNFGLLFEAQYYRLKSHIGIIENGLSNMSIKQYDFDFKYLKTNAAAKYSFTQSDIKPFIIAGITNSFVINAKSGYSHVQEGSVEVDDTYLKDEKPGVYEMGFLGGAGLNYKNYGLEARYEVTSGFDLYDFYNAKPKVFYLLLTYRF